MSETLLNGGKYKLFMNKELGRGSFGNVYLGQDNENNSNYAIKVEPKKNKYCLLETEYNIIRYTNQREDSHPVIHSYWFGSDKKNYYLVTDLLGKSLDKLKMECGGKFSLKTVLMLAEQIIHRVKFYHDRNIIHRDIKPENFLIEKNDTDTKKIYLIDFGLARKYRKSSNKQHIPYRENKPHIGTARYMSIYAHERKEQSRRDDMYSVGYVLLYFL